MEHAHFERILGNGHVLTSKKDLLAYSYDASGLEFMPEVVVFPGTIEELHKIIIFCNRSSKSFVVRGFGSGHQGGSIGLNAVIIDMSRLCFGFGL